MISENTDGLSGQWPHIKWLLLPEDNFKTYYLKFIISSTMHGIRSWLTALSPARRAASAMVAGLPVYQVALWPDGWVLQTDGRVQVRDTHAAAEARRWYALAARNQCRSDSRYVMSQHRVFVPRAIVAMKGQVFSSEQVASVAMQLVAGEWIRERRRLMLNAPIVALAEGRSHWCGSRHDDRGQACDSLTELLQGLIDLCRAEGMIPDLCYRLSMRVDVGYGLCRYRCIIEAPVTRLQARAIVDVLMVALIPWNRAVVQDGGPVPLVRVIFRKAL